MAFSYSLRQKCNSTHNALCFGSLPIVGSGPVHTWSEPNQSSLGCGPLGPFWLSTVMYLSVCIQWCTVTCLSVCLSTVLLSVCLSVCIQLCTVTCLSGCVAVCLSVYSASLSEIFLHGVVWSIKLPRVCGCCVGGWTSDCLLWQQQQDSRTQTGLDGPVQ